MDLLTRKASLQKLREFCRHKGAGLIFVRGRRRVGKTWLLQELENELGSNCMRFLCRKHRRDSTFLHELVSEWAQKSEESTLTQIKTSALTWKLLFDSISAYAERYKKQHGASYVLIIDEIQWLSTDYAQSAGILKAAWDELTKKGSLNVILCGSSSKFFVEQLGEGSPLRGVNTQSSINVLPFPISTFKHEAAPAWSLKETVLAYMCIGGIPYYWQRAPIEKGFRRAMNDACCISSTIFLEEWREIIATEFRTDAVENLSLLFPALMTTEDGVTAAEITEKLGVSPSTTSRLLEKLVNYGYVIRCSPESSTNKDDLAKTSHGDRYLLSDFYLHFYFSVLRPMEREIRINQAGLLFPYQILHGEAKEYIPAFTGKAFERFVFHHIDVALREGEESKNTIQEISLGRALDLPDANYETRWNVLVKGDSSEKILSQIDLLITHEGEKSVRVLECKWKNKGAPEDIEEVTGKLLPARLRHYSRRNFLVISYEPTQQFLLKAAEAGVTVIPLAEFVKR